MKRIFVLLMMALVLVGCGNNAKTNNEAEKTTNNSTTTSESSEDTKKKVTVTTSFLYDMVNQLAGDHVESELIIPAGEDPHLYVAKPQDLEKIKNADLVLYHGLHFEGKMIDILEERGFAVASTFPKDEIGEMEEDGQTIIDPHFWFNIKLYKEATENAGKQLQELLPENAEEIQKNTDDYLKKLDELDAENKELLSQIPEGSRYLITPHDAFNYFARAYNIEVVSPQGVSTDSEVANKDIDNVVNFIVDNKVKAIFAESTTDPARMEKIKEGCAAKGFEVKVVSGEGNELFSDSLAPSGEDGDTYIDMYKHNVKLITDNLK